MNTKKLAPVVQVGPHDELEDLALCFRFHYAESYLTLELQSWTLPVVGVKGLGAMKRKESREVGVAHKPLQVVLLGERGDLGVDLHQIVGQLLAPLQVGPIVPSLEVF